MKVKELIEQLKMCNPEQQVILQGDPEGNLYHWCQGAEDNNRYREGDHCYGPDELQDISTHTPEEYAELLEELPLEVTVIYP